MYILDTDHVSLFQRNHPVVVARVSEIAPDKLAIAIVTLEEQMRGRLNKVRRAKSDDEIVRAYKSLHSMFLYFQSIIIIDFDEKSQGIFRDFRRRKIRIGTQDLRIAAVALAHDATVVTRNRQDFESVPLLKIEDWSKFESGWPG